jgi:DNA helicase-2/ATP-dependent DNA helicase PcrA
MADPIDQTLLAPLNPAQRAAVENIEGPLLIVAGPGSGKTRVITHRIAYMIARGVPSQKIVALTFTNKAADEMRKRLAVLAPNNFTWSGTFHRFCSRLLRVHAAMVGLQENFTIYDMTDTKKVIKQAIENTEVDIRHYSADSVGREISNVKNVAVTPEKFQPRNGNAMDNIVAQVYPEYQKLLQMANAVDFDDLLMHTVDLLTQNSELRKALDLRFEYMMVDEYQDTNIAQYQLIRLLNHTKQNLAVTGDPDQSIYGWRGANIRNILEFEKDFPDVSVVRLEQNYRSTKSILRVADQLIANNVRRKKKVLVTDNDEGQQVRLVAYPEPQDEAVDIADSITLAQQKGVRKFSDFAILYRTNYLSRTLEHALRSAGVPYQVVNGHEFYQRREIKDLIAYLHLINNDRDMVAFERVVNVPSRKIGKVTLSRLRNYARENNVTMMDAARNVDMIDTISAAPSSKLKQFTGMIDSLQQSATQEVETILRDVLVQTDYRQWLTLDGSEEAFERANNVDELVVAAQEFDAEHPEDGGLEKYLEQTALVSDTDVYESKSDYVTMMSLHAAKGLEFKKVFIIGLEDGILPHERSCADDEQIEEERRLLFVGITRAEEELQLSRCLNRFRRGSYWPAIASRFLMELPRDEMQVFEPRGQQHGMTDQQLQDTIAKMSDWSSDLPVYTDNDDAEPSITTPTDPISPTAIQDSGSDVPKPKSQALAASVVPSIADMMTGAQLEAKQSDGTKRLDPDEYSIGLDVEHVQYGVGTVVMLSGAGKKRTATVDFPDYGEKQFRVAFSNLRSVVS